jgi:hypothetical protein
MKMTVERSLLISTLIRTMKFKILSSYSTISELVDGKAKCELRSLKTFALSQVPVAQA